MRSEDIKSSVPLFLRDAEPFGGIYDAYGAEMDILRSKMSQIQDQFLVKNASWGLDLWEEFLGLETNKYKTDEERRSIILSKIRGVGTVTAEMLEAVCQSYENGSLEVVEIPEEHRILLKFTELNGTPPNEDEFAKFVQEVIPAHLKFEFVYKYNTYGQVGTKTYEELSAMTYETIRTSDDLV